MYHSEVDQTTLILMPLLLLDHASADKLLHDVKKVGLKFWVVTALTEFPNRSGEQNGVFLAYLTKGTIKNLKKRPLMTTCLSQL